MKEIKQSEKKTTYRSRAQIIEEDKTVVEYFRTHKNNSVEEISKALDMKPNAVSKAINRHFENKMKES